MTQEELQELDSWLAEHVMGWQWMRPTPAQPRKTRPVWVQGGLTKYLVSDWHPSSDLVQAEEVLNQTPDEYQIQLWRGVETVGGVWELIPPEPEYSPSSWACCIGPRAGTPGKDATESADLLALAICLATRTWKEGLG